MMRILPGVAWPTLAASLIALCAIGAQAGEMTEGELAQPELTDEEKYEEFSEYHAFRFDGPKTDEGVYADIFISNWVKDRFWSLYGPEDFSSSLETLSDEALSFRVRAVRELTFYDQSARAIDALVNAFNAAADRGLASERLHATLFKRLLHARRFEQAGEFKAAHDFDSRYSLPAEWSKDESLSSPSVWTHSEDGVLHRESVRLDGKQVILVASPKCDFSMAALESLLSDDDTASIITDRTVLLVPAQADLTLTQIEQWNRAHPDIPMQIIHKKSEWPMIASWATPTFHFVEDGDLSSEFFGWPEEGKKTEFLRHSEDLGIVSEEKSGHREFTQ